MKAKVLAGGVIVAGLGLALLLWPTEVPEDEGADEAPRAAADDAEGAAAPSEEALAPAAAGEGTAGAEAAAAPAGGGEADHEAEARVGPFEATPEGVAELFDRHLTRVGACRRALASKAKGKVPVTLTVKPSQGGMGYVADVKVADGVEGVNISFGPCLVTAFADARFENLAADTEIDTTIAVE